jgi:hypothetical protein
MTTIAERIEAQKNSAQALMTTKQSGQGAAEGSSFQGLVSSAVAGVAPSQDRQRGSDADGDEASPRSLYMSQRIGQDSSDEESLTSDAVEAFRRFAKAAQDGPAALMREQYLASKGLTEDDVAAMPLEERKKLEEEIAEFIKNKMEEETGIVGQETNISTVA